MLSLHDYEILMFFTGLCLIVVIFVLFMMVISDYYLILTPYSKKVEWVRNMFFALLVFLANIFLYLVVFSSCALFLLRS